ncbi:MAG: LytS/YhcK type 5TM receptor domain-containing protein [Candidatus Bathyarchaeia archaeon]|jgi:LytS/YehU family sensor histidine kinase
MIDISYLTNTLALLSTASLMIVVSLVCFNLKPFKLQAKNLTLFRVAVGLLFGLLAIFATLTGVKLPDGITINVRELAVVIAGVAGGPVSGLIAGLIGGLHRFTLGGISALCCTISTILLGMISGLVSTKISGKSILLKAGLLGLGLESFAMALLPLFLPWDTAVSVLIEAAVPMIAATTIGLMLWVYLFKTQKSSPKNP